MLATILTILTAASVHNPRPLATLIYKVSAQEQVDAILLTKVVIVESRGDARAVNVKSGDYGLVQIHLDSHPYVGIVCAMNAECNLRAGAKILKSVSRVCRYNVGTGKLIGKRLENCLTYEKRLSIVAEGEISE